MKFDAIITPDSLAEAGRTARHADAAGFDALWTSETKHNPFLPLAAVATSSERIRFGTAIAVGLARSPTDLAHLAWDLAGESGGRFILGLGSQVRAHVVQRFGMPWPESPTAKMEELIGAIRALWRTWATGERLWYRGEYFKLSLMTPFFTPDPIDHPEIPIFIAGVNRGMCRLAGRAADGLHGHPFHTARYLRDVVRPAVAEGASSAGRSPDEIEISTTVFVVRSDDEAHAVRQQIAFYASTPNYRPVLDLHGWGEIGEQLSEAARAGQWDEMASLVSDDILDQVAVRAPAGTLASALLDRYVGLVDRLNLYLPYWPDDPTTDWHNLAREIQSL